MKTRESRWSEKAAPALAALAGLVLGIGALSRALAGLPRLPAHFSGLLNDYTPSSVNGVPIKGGPYEMHGKWSLDVDQVRGTAVFTADMTMATVDFTNPDPSFDPGKLGSHTHHISVMDGVLDNDPAAWKTVCAANPALNPPVTGGFAVTGTAYVTGNGANPPFGNPSKITICILGGTSTGVPGTAYVEFSNLTLTFDPTSHASTHFGQQPIHGVVSTCDSGPGVLGFPVGSEACRVTVLE